MIDDIAGPSSWRLLLQRFGAAIFVAMAILALFLIYVVIPWQRHAPCIGGRDCPSFSDAMFLLTLLGFFVAGLWGARCAWRGSKPALLFAFLPAVVLACFYPDSALVFLYIFVPGSSWR